MSRYNPKLTGVTFVICLGLGFTSPVYSQITPTNHGAISSTPPAVALDSINIETKDESDWTEVTVTADLSGPALWKVSKNDAQVYILGSMPVMVKRHPWDTSRISRIMAKSDEFITSPQMKGGIMSFAAWEITRSKKHNLFDILPSALSMRMRTMIKKHGLEVKTYAKLHPVVAVTQLKDDIYAKNNLTARDPEKHLIFIARAAKTPMRPMKTYDAKTLITRLKKFSDSEQIICIHKTLNEVDFALKHASDASLSWGQGDILAAKSHMPYPSALSCLEGASSTRTLVEDATQDALMAVNEALKKPGKTLMVLPLTVLLRKGGAFERLKAEGADISIPKLED